MEIIFTPTEGLFITRFGDTEVKVKYDDNI